MPIPPADVAAVARAVIAGHPDGTPDAIAGRRILTLLDSDHQGWARRTAPTHVTVSVVLVHPGTPDTHPRTLLSLHPRFGRWMQLGGHLEPTDTTLTGAALRETHEESGQHPGLIADLVLLGAGAFDHVRCGQLPAGSTHLDIRYLAITHDTALVRSDESIDLAWWPLHQLPEPHDADLALPADQARHTLSARR